MIYCVDDEKEMRELMVYTLEKSGIEAIGLSDAKELYAALEERLPDLIILDIMLPGEDGLSILKRLRLTEKTAEIPVILATAKVTEMDKVNGLDMGADGYLTKPFGMMEMTALAKAVMRRNTHSEPDVKHVGNLEICPGERRISCNGTPICLTFKEYELLNMLLNRPKQVFSREQIISNIWGIEYYGETRTVDVHIGSVRAKLSQVDSGVKIVTVREIGYKLEVTV